MITKISHHALNHALGKDLSVEDIHSALEKMGMELKGNEQDGELTVEITPDRLDLLSVQGLARALRCFLQLQENQPSYAVHESEYEVYVKASVQDVRPHTRCAVVKGLDITQDNLKDIIALQEKLHATLARNRSRGAIGIYPLEHISWPIRFSAADPQDISFTPLGETKKLTGKQIVQDTQIGASYGHLLRDKKHYPYFIDAQDNVLSMPPLINSQTTGCVDTSTTDVFIECSGFDTDMLHQLLVHITTMFAEMGGTVYGVRVVYEGKETITTPKLTPRPCTLPLNLLKQRIGISLSRQEIQKHLTRMMYDIHSRSHPEEWELRVPCFRFDVWHPVDIVDDIARSHGYNSIKLTTPQVISNASTLPLSKLREELTHVMVGLGFLENYTFSLTSKEEQLTRMRLGEDDVDFVPIANGMETQTMLRVSLLPQQLTTLAHNKRRSLPQRLCEGAFVVLPDRLADTGARNELKFCGVYTDEKVSFTDIRQVLDALLRTKGIQAVFKPAQHPSFIPGRCASVHINDQDVGLIGELHPEVLVSFGLQNPVGVFEINIEPLIK